jgi:hypothetical protein
MEAEPRRQQAGADVVGVVVAPRERAAGESAADRGAAGWGFAFHITGKPVDVAAEVDLPFTYFDRVQRSRALGREQERQCAGRRNEPSVNFHSKFPLLLERGVACVAPHFGLSRRQRQPQQ